MFPERAQREPPASLRDFNTITMDGKAIKNVARRLKHLRGVGGGLLGGRALVATHYETGLVIGMHADEDGDANDVRFVPDLLRDHWNAAPMADSGFCDVNAWGF